MNRAQAIIRETCPVCGKKVGLGGQYGQRLSYHGPKGRKCSGSMGFSVEHREHTEKWVLERANMTPEQILQECLRGAW